MNSAILALEDGTVFEGRSFGAPAERSGEVVFNTALTGYQEVFTDPSYSGQIVILTNPQIGNYGTSARRQRIRAALHRRPGRARVFRHRQQLALRCRSRRVPRPAHGIPVVSDLDTRALVRHLRTRGVMRGVLSAIEKDAAKLVEKARSIPTMAGLDLASRVSTPERYEWIAAGGTPARLPSWWAARAEPRYPRGGLRFRHQAQHPAPPGAGRAAASPWCRRSLPPKTCSRSSPTASSSPTAPAIPSRSQTQVANIRKLIGKKPIFGICLGHQLLGLAVGGKTYKLKFGHRGANHPVRNELTKRVEITSHNHGFAVDPDSLNLNEVEITHVNLNDQTLEGFRHRSHPVFCVQYHPEAAPGPHDSHYLFDDFVKLMSERAVARCPDATTSTAS